MFIQIKSILENPVIYTKAMNILDLVGLGVKM